MRKPKIKPQGWNTTAVSVKKPASTKSAKPKAREKDTTKSTKPPSARKAMSVKAPGAAAPVKARARMSSERPKKGTRETKQARVITLLKRPGGATLTDLVSATGWQRHSVRGVISGVLKKRVGLTIRSEKGARGERSYRIVGHG